MNKTNKKQIVKVAKGYAGRFELHIGAIVWEYNDLADVITASIFGPDWQAL